MTARGRRHIRGAAAYALLIVSALFFLLPFVWLLQLSLKTQMDAFAFPPALLFQPTVENFVGLWQEEHFGQYFLNSVVLAVSTTLFSAVIGVPTAYALVRLKRRWPRAVLSWVFVARMAPAMLYVLPFFVAFSALRLLDSLAGLTLAYLTFGVPTAIWLMRSFFLDFPVSLEEAAVIDGATISQVFLKIALPLAAPGIVATLILIFVTAWNEFIFALILTRHAAVTAPIAIVNLMKYAGTEWGKMAAGAIVLLAPAVVLAVFANKYLIKGLATGAVKE